MRLDGGFKAEGDVGGAGGGAAPRTGGAAMGIGRLEVGEGPDGWGLPASCWEGRGVLGRVGRKRGNGPRGKKQKKEVGRGSRWASGGLGRLDSFCFFLFFFQIHFKYFFQTFLNQIFYIFSNSNFNTNFSKYFKGFSQTIFNNFLNIF
jgi:hypothetical protein